MDGLFILVLIVLFIVAGFQVMIEHIGAKNIICPHCQTKGTVRTTKKEVKAGVHGGKATAGILTGGLSLFATGLSRKVPKTKLKCSKCKIVWYV